MRPKDADGIANSADPDQTAPVGDFVMSWLILFWSPSYSDLYGKLKKLIESDSNMTYVINT